MAAKLFSAPYAKQFNLREIAFSDETQILIADYVTQREEKGERVRPSELFEILEETCEELNEILDLNYEDKLSGEIAEKFFFDSVRSLRGAKIEEDIAKCNALYAATTDEEERKKIAKQLSELVRRKSSLRK